VIEPKNLPDLETGEVRPTAAANLNEFHTKYSQFEQKQLASLHTSSNGKKSVAVLKSASTREVTFDEPPPPRATRSRKSTVPVAESPPNLKSSIISNLIERGLKLKSEMSKSTSNLSAQVHRSLEMYNTISSANFDTNNFSFLNETNMTNDTSFCNNLNDISRLSDPLHDPSMLSALIYSNHCYARDGDLANESVNYVSQFDENDATNVDDAELRELLAPTDLFSRLAKQPTTTTDNYDTSSFEKVGK
jgi:hypothetical protein